MNNKYTKKHIQLGGKKIGKGGFTCVIKPAITCKTKKYNNTIVSKITKKKQFTKTYKEVNNKLKVIDPEQQYFIYYDTYCNLKKTDIAKRFQKDLKIINDEDSTYLLSDLDDLDDLYCEIDKKHSYININENYGGDSLYKILQYNTLPIKSNISDIITNLLNGLKLLHDNKIVHRDIKIDNITITKEKKRLSTKYIDFNNATFSTKINRISLIGNYSYNISLDYLIFFYLHIFINNRKYDFNTKLINIISKLCIKNIKSSLMILSNIDLSFTSIISLETNIIHTYKEKDGDIENLKFNKLIKLVHKKFKTVNKSKKQLLTYFKNELVYKNDIYGLGIVFKIIKTKLDIPDKAFNHKLTTLIDKMTNILPEKRINITEAVNIWNE